MLENDFECATDYKEKAIAGQFLLDYKLVSCVSPCLDVFAEFFEIIIWHTLKKLDLADLPDSLPYDQRYSLAPYF